MKSEKEFMNFLKDLTKGIVDRREEQEEKIKGKFFVEVSGEKISAGMDVDELVLFTAFMANRSGTEKAEQLEEDIMNKFSTIKNEISQLTTMIYHLFSLERKSNEN